MRSILIFCFSLMMIVGSSQAQDVRRMSVSGQGIVLVAPDMATLTLGVSTFDKQASRAMNANSQEMNKVMDAVISAGIAKKDIQTQQLSLFPRWDNRSGTQERVISGYEAVNTISIRVLEISSLGSVIDTVAKVGANRIQGIQFGIQNQRPHLDEARKRAVIDARAKAKVYAEAAGVTLAEIMHISEPTSQIQPRGMMRAEMSMVRDSAPIAEGEMSISATIDILFGLY